jgi:hypothetical protein
LTNLTPIGREMELQRERGEEKGRRRRGVGFTMISVNDNKSITNKPENQKNKQTNITEMK